MLPSISLFFLFCFDFRNAILLLFCHPSLVKQNIKELQTCPDKSDKQDKQNGQQLLNSVQHKLNFTSDNFVEDSHANLFSPALKSTIKKYQIRTDFPQKAAVLKKG